MGLLITDIPGEKYRWICWHSWKQRLFLLLLLIYVAMSTFHFQRAAWLLHYNFPKLLNKWALFPKYLNATGFKETKHHKWPQHKVTSVGGRRSLSRKKSLLIIVINFGVEISTKICSNKLNNFFPDNSLWQIIHLAS